jgi:hypothetical protein
MWSAAYLGTVCVEGRLLVPQFNGLGVELERGGPVLVLEGFIALVLERGGVFLGIAHGRVERAGHGAGVRQARRNGSGKGDGWLQRPFGESK